MNSDNENNTGLTVGAQEKANVALISKDASN